ncbi:class I SAM-dependent RNA methyltransferase [Agromyces intestinalis]|uniref:Class I SAM-dependent RNA methyltransferase n=1 Tax=Agromyces intestinalis TaxID=2592652 RepID=A0A5C1YEX7_9MICO|nr:class I SAM-dependent RNA methyltransferase [Agromyces intestinalis]QEO13579.1 class I SAM-dependent RNA methyltransferase [Agromyces intestinalis]
MARPSRHRTSSPTGAKRTAHARRRTPAASASPVPGPELVLDVDRIAHGGVAVARHEGRVVFVADAIPGERVRAQVIDASRDRFWRAETVEVLDASPDRREHVWAEASVDRAPEQRAGGAEFGHIRMPRQRALKAEVLQDALARMAGEQREVVVEAVDEELAPGVDVEAGTGWRTRVRLHVDAEGRVGPYAARSHRVVPVTSLPLAAAALQRLAPLDTRFEAAGADGVEAVDLVAPTGAEASVIIRRAGERETAPEIVELVGDRRFRLARDGFWQVHRGAAATLTRAVQAAIDPERFDPGAEHLDLYGGVGLLAAAVGDGFGRGLRITSVEADARATDHAAANLADFVGARAVTARVDRFLAELERSDASRSIRGGTVVLDPPRSGAGREVTNRVAALRPAQIVYVACDPVALARDLGTFRDLGYGLEHVRAFDLFPNTHHVEAVARLGAIV